MPSHFWSALAWMLRRASNGTLWKLHFAASDELGRRARVAGEKWDREHETNEAFGV